MNLTLFCTLQNNYYNKQASWTYSILNMVLKISLIRDFRKKAYKLGEWKVKKIRKSCKYIYTYLHIYLLLLYICLLNKSVIIQDFHNFFSWEFDRRNLKKEIKRSSFNQPQIHFWSHLNNPSNVSVVISRCVLYDILLIVQKFGNFGKK